MLVSLSTITPEQTQGTTNTAKNIAQFLNYLATNTDAIICFIVHIDASYLSCDRARNIAGGIHQLSSEQNLQNPDIILDQINRILHVMRKIPRKIIASAGESRVECPPH